MKNEDEVQVKASAKKSDVSEKKETATNRGAVKTATNRASFSEERKSVAPLLISVATVSLICGALITFGLMWLNKKDAMNCDATAPDNAQTAQEEGEPNGAPFAYDQGYAEDRAAFDAMSIYIEYTNSVAGWAYYPQMLFPGTTRTQLEDPSESTMAFKFDIDYEAFLARSKQLFGSSVIDVDSMMNAGGKFQYYNCDGMVCLTAAKGLGGIAPRYTKSAADFEVLGNGKYAQTVSYDDYNEYVEVKYTAQFENGVMTSIVREEL